MTVSARAFLVFEPPRNGVSSTCDLVLDLSGGSPLFPAYGRRDGYFRPDPGDPAAVQRALFELTDLVGEIGRASCRERVCQYVAIPVVAVSLKKKDNIKR